MSTDNETRQAFETLLAELTAVKRHVIETRSWFERHAWPKMLCFRAVGVLVIGLSVSVPFIAAQNAPWKDPAVSAVALVIALLTGLNSFFRWEHAWQGYRQTQFALEHLLALWDLRIIDAKHQEDQRTAAAMAIRATEQLLVDSRAVTSAETAEYFKLIELPHDGKGK
jgi:Protein of unknown function (DUF4231)